MKAPPLRAVALALACFASSAAAQATGTLDLGLFGQASYFDNSLRMDQGRGGPGVRLGIFVVPNIDLEAEGAFVPTDASGGLLVHYIPLRGRVVLNIPTSEHGSFLLGGGYVRNQYRHDLHFNDNGVTALVGARFGFPGSITTLPVWPVISTISRPPATAPAPISIGDCRWAWTSCSASDLQHRRPGRSRPVRPPAGRIPWP